MMIIGSNKKNFNGKFGSYFDNLLFEGPESASTKIAGLLFT